MRSRSAAPVLVALALLTQLLLAGATSARDRRAPAPRSLPRISGSPMKGHTLKASHGRWKNHPTRFHFRWLACNGAGKKCQKVAGHGATYRLGARAVRHRVEQVRRRPGHVVRDPLGGRGDCPTPATASGPSTPTAASTPAATSGAPTATTS